MGADSRNAKAEARIIRRVIGGTPYYYDQSVDVIHTGDRKLGYQYDRTQTDRPVDLCIELTTACNFTCKNCFSSSARGLGGSFIDMSAALEAIRTQRDGIIRVCVTGGEPMLHPRIAEMLSIPRELPDVGFVLSTNGTARVDLDPLIREHGWLVGLSLHGGELHHNKYTNSESWRRVIRRAADLARTNVVHLYCVLSESLAAHDVDFLLRLRDEIGADFVRFITPRAFGRFELLDSTSGVIEIVTERLDDRSGLKVEASKTAFISSTLERRRTS